MSHIYINYLAVVVAAAVAWILGAVWYSPLLFAKHWVAAHGFSDETMARMRQNAKVAYLISAGCDLLIALAIAVLVGYLDLHRPMQGAKLGLLLWAGFAFAIGLTGSIFSDKRRAVFWIDTAYQLLYLVLMGALIAAWR